MERGGEKRAHAKRAFDAVAHVEKSPALRPGHVLSRQPLKRREAEQGLVDDAQRVASQRRAVRHRLPEAVVQVAERAPEVVRGAMTEYHRQPLQLVGEVTQAVGSRRIEYRGEQLGFERFDVLAQFGALPGAGNLPLRL